MGDSSTAKEKSNEPINVSVHGQDGSVIRFKIRRTTPFKKLINVYCQRMGLSVSNVRFTCDGEHVQYEDTPESLDINDNDTIEVFHTQTGGF
uniref:Small ubiquitin-related modifier n=1 Tax=Mesocestoides corti TaxID=53468 RepID=A0A5K3F9V5_MESCO